MTSPGDRRSRAGIGGTRGAADHQQLPSSDLEMIGRVAATANGHAPDMKHGGADEPASDPAVYSLEEEDADLVVGAEILGPNAASPGMKLAAHLQIHSANTGCPRMTTQRQLNGCSSNVLGRTWSDEARDILFGVMLAVAEDADVTAERRRVSAAAAAGGLRDIISITNLRKQYDNSSKKVCDGVCH